MFSTKLPKRKPDWLIGPKGQTLELDGFSEEKNIAFEYQGDHHYKIVGRYSQSRIDEVRARDAIKRRLCYDRGINLIVIPDFKRGLDLKGRIDQIEAYVLMAGLKIPRGWKRPSEIPNALDPLYIAYGAKRVEAMHEAAARRGGQLISKAAASTRSPLLWRCHLGHEWPAREDSIVDKGSWCPYCSGRRGRTAGTLNDWAARLGGKCLSPEYVGISARYRWKCAVGHEWECRANEVARGHWCRKCADAVNANLVRDRARKNGNTLDGMRRLAASRGGECLSDEYKIGVIHLRWRCSKGHEWVAQPVSVKRGTWCPYCAFGRPPAYPEFTLAAD